ncbi:MAG: hypothetical protein R2788_12705 [Saprospiraceae bacterium]
MMKNNFAVLLLLAVPIWFCALPSCTNDKLGLQDEMEMPVDTVTGVVCHPDTLYFELEVLPILKSSCSGRRDCYDTGDLLCQGRYENGKLPDHHGNRGHPAIHAGRDKNF